MGVTIRELDQPGDLGWVVQAHGEMYAREYGWDTTFEELVAGIVGRVRRATGTRPASGAGSPRSTGSGQAACSARPGRTRTTARLRILLVDPKHRGLGLGAAPGRHLPRLRPRGGLRDG